MTEQKTALLLIGSPKGPNSTSASIADYLTERLKEKGLDARERQIYPALRSEDEMAEVMAAVSRADVLILSFPLYADSPPSGVIEMMEAIADQRKPKMSPALVKSLERLARLLEDDRIGSALAIIATLVKVPFLPTIIAGALISVIRSRKTHKQAAAKIREYLKSDEPREQKLIAVSNSGFLEASRSDSAIAICRRFASETGIEWNGGIGFGGGAAVDGRPLAKAGRITGNLIKALDMTAGDIAAGRPVSQKAIDTAAAPTMPNWLYILMGNIGFRLQAWKNRVWRRMNARPLEVADNA